jgi:hypothetical protein
MQQESKLASKFCNSRSTFLQSYLNCLGIAKAAKAEKGGVATALIPFCRIWHGKLKLKGAGYLISSLSSFTRSLQNYSLTLREAHEAKAITVLAAPIKADKPVIFFEHLSLSGTQIKDIIPSGYEIFTVASIKGHLMRGFDRSLGHNSALLPATSTTLITTELQRPHCGS